jgi:lactate dehydrogenase-like 2-hydroxyacid dehydrogenase
MKEFKGTPGPWNYCAEEPDWVTDSNDNIAVARVTRYNTDAEAQHANAKLISAAPELLEALQSLINDKLKGKVWWLGGVAAACTFIIVNFSRMKDFFH